MIKITNCKPEIQKIIEDYLYKETDIGDFVEDISMQSVRDFIIYGYNPWDYLEETKLNLKEQKLEDILDSITNPLKNEGLEIIERQKEICLGNKIDLICKNQKGDLVVVELKKYGANETIGQLARYLTDVRENYAKSTQKVAGMILALHIDEQLIKAARGVDFEVKLYQITFS